MCYTYVGRHYVYHIHVAARRVQAASARPARRAASRLVGLSIKSNIM